jgi:hypothetical protein
MTSLPPTETKYLQDRELQRWIKICNKLLIIFDGIEQVIENENEYPLPTLQYIINQTIREDTISQNKFIHNQILKYPLFRWRARKGKKLWNPLRTPLKDFDKSKTVFWEETTPYPKKPDIETWLHRELNNQTH